jgi:hypothetical protein
MQDNRRPFCLRSGCKWHCTQRVLFLFLRPLSSSALPPFPLDELEYRPLLFPHDDLEYRPLSSGVDGYGRLVRVLLVQPFIQLDALECEKNRVARVAHELEVLSPV